MNHDEVLARVAQLEAALTRKTIETVMHMWTLRGFSPSAPLPPLTPEQKARVFADPEFGAGMRQIVAELERGVA